MNLIEVEENLYDKMLPLDLILFKGNDLISRIVEDIEYYNTGYSDVSHVGMVVTSEILPSIPELEPNKIYIWESTSSLVIPETNSTFIPDVETKTTRFGVQIRELKLVVDAYNGDVYWAKLKNSPWLNPNKRDKLLSDMKEIHQIYKQTHYESNPISLISSACRYFRPLRNLIDYTVIVIHMITNLLRITHGTLTQLDVEELTVFCSEFVCIVFIILGIIPQTEIPYDITPINISDTLPYLIDTKHRLYPSKIN